MLRPHIRSAGAGSLGTVLFKLVLDCLNSPVPPVVSEYPPEFDQVETQCEVDRDLAAEGPLAEWLGDLEARSFLVGLAVGIVCGPLVDFLFLLRLWWAQSVQRVHSRFQRVSRQLYRLLE